MVIYCTNRIPILSAFEMVQPPSLSMKPNLKVIESPLTITFVASNMLSFQLFQLPSDKTCFAENKSPDEIRIFR